MKLGTAKNRLVKILENRKAPKTPQIRSWALWGDTRIICQHWIAEFTRCSITNPGGIDWDSTLNIYDVAALRARLDARADQIVYECNAIDAQGVVVWDLWQEFGHSTTYLGDPQLVAILSPELDAQLDRFFGRIKAGGLRIGTTLRPQYVPYGNSLPPLTDIYNSNKYVPLDMFIVLTDPSPYRLWVKWYADWGDGKAPHWEWAEWHSAHPDDGPGQVPVYYGQEKDVITRLTNRIEYCRNRWGMSIFYVDSTVYNDGNPLSVDVFKALHSKLPNVLIAPENEGTGYWDVCVPYNQVNVGQFGTPNSTKGMVLLSFAGLSNADYNTYKSYLKGEWRGGRLIPMCAHYDTTAIAQIRDMMS